jgi:hypothetical protein
MSKIEGLFSTSYNYFSKYLKQHLEFSKLFEIIETNWAKIFKNVKTCWTSMLSLTRCVMFKYMTWLMTMGLTMTRQRLILTFFVMSKFYWVLPYYPCYNQFTTWLNSANWKHCFHMWFCGNNQNLPRKYLCFVYGCEHQVQILHLWWL